MCPPLLTYTATDFPFTPSTKILSNSINTNYNDIKTLLNTTGLDDTNLQNAGISLTKLKTTGFTAGQFIAYNGTAFVATSNPLQTSYNRIVGSAAQVTAGTAQYSTIASAISAASAGDRILILTEYSGTENVSVSKKLFISGLGHTSVITGTVTFTSAADYSMLQNVKVTDNITLDSGADGIYVSNIWLASGKTFTDNGTANMLTAIQE